jgi:glyoxylase-like metal-dependent hydrolase (beta-lactamase superfamily II)
MAILIPWAQTLVCGDYLSPVEIPMISEGGSLSAYRATLERLAALVERVETVIPGHGAPIGRDTALGILGDDLAYLEALESRGADAPLPPRRRTGEQRRIHGENVSRSRR